MKISAEKSKLKNEPEQKPILAIETSEEICGVCLYFSEKKMFNSSTKQKNSHAEKLFEAIDFVLKISNTSINFLETIAVSAGPGSFTGLRIGMSAAKGLAFGANLPVCPVPTFEALALQIAEILPDGSNYVIANKVNKEEVYFAQFKVVSNNYIFAENLRIIGLEELNVIDKNISVFGNCRLEGTIPLSTPNPEYIAKWFKLFGAELATTNYDYLEPNYLKEFIIRGMGK